MLNGCSSPPDDTPPIGDAYYALSVVTFGPNNEIEGTIKFAPTLDAGAVIDETLTLESTGTAPLFPAESSDRLLNVLGKSGEIVKFALTEDGIQQEGEKIGFSAYGISAFRAPIIHIFSPTQAYLWDDLTFKAVRWDPSTMTIDKEITGVTAQFEGKNKGPDGTSYWTFRARAPLQVGEKVYVPISYLDEPTVQHTLPHSGMFVLDSVTDQVTFVEHPTCAGLENQMLAPDGLIYVASNSYAAADFITGHPGINAPCLVRFDPQTDTFDPSFQGDLIAAAGGKVVAGLVQRSGASAHVKVFNESLFPPDKSLDSARDVHRSPAWELHLLEDVTSPTSLVKADAKATSALLYPFRIDGDWHAASVDYSVLSSSLVDMSTSPPTPGLVVDGITSFAVHLQR